MNTVQLIENKKVKMVIFPLGVLITLAAIFGSFYGLAIGYNGIITGQPWLILLGIVTILALLGITGAWLRYSCNASSISPNKLTIVRVFLICGLAASVYLALVFIYVGSWSGGFLFLSLTFGAGIFLYATPKRF